MKFFIMMNSSQNSAVECAELTASILLEKGCDVYASESNRDLFSEGVIFGKTEEIIKNCDMLLCIGGDGTFIHSSEFAFNNDIPILGINKGRLGYLTQIETNELEDRIDMLLKGHYSIVKRMLLSTRINAHSFRKTFYSLNEIVVRSSLPYKMVDIEASCDGIPFLSYYADGVMAATPTGSTGYSFSSGGPIVEPNVDSITVTPIAPHSMNSRSILFGADRIIRFSEPDGYPNQSLLIISDGKTFCECDDLIEIIITKAQKPIKFVHFNDISFCNILKRKIIDRR